MKWPDAFNLWKWSVLTHFCGHLPNTRTLRLKGLSYFHTKKRQFREVKPQPIILEFGLDLLEIEAHLPDLERIDFSQR